ncbi:MAG TPA: hypothetical protein VH559_16425 [Gemmatimonadaceae bacterium]|jgi:hypothetical protein
MELWDKDYLELEGPAHITFDRDRLGSFQFGAVRGWIDYRQVDRNGKPAVEFSWEGHNDADASCGRGWAIIDGDRTTGRLFLHNGDDSAFVARKEPRAGATSKSDMAGA